MSNKKRQELFNKNKRELAQRGIKSRFMAYLFYKCEADEVEAGQVSHRKVEKMTIGHKIAINNAF
jgi:hypothetical protein